jgi:DNA polymerase
LGVDARVKACDRCELHKSRTNAVIGEGNIPADVMFIGEGPGETEDKTGKPFCGKAGEVLDKMLALSGLAREMIYIANVVKCRPPGNRKPLENEVEACLPYLREQITEVRPKVIVLLGQTVVTAFGIEGTMQELHGKTFEKANKRLFVMYHPAAVLYKKDTIVAVEGDCSRLSLLLQSLDIGTFDGSLIVNLIKTVIKPNRDVFKPFMKKIRDMPGRFSEFGENVIKFVDYVIAASAKEVRGMAGAQSNKEVQFLYQSLLAIDTKDAVLIAIRLRLEQDLDIIRAFEKSKSVAIKEVLKSRGFFGQREKLLREILNEKE